MIVAAVMTDHPSWLSADNGVVYRAVRCGTSVWALTCTPACSSGYGTAACLVSGVGEPQVVDVLDRDLDRRERSGGAAAGSRDGGAVAQPGSVGRPGHLDHAPDHPHRAGSQALPRVCQAHGEPVSTPVGHTWLFPIPEIVLALSDTEFGRLGLAFKCRLLRAAAQAYLEFGQKWVELDPTELVHEVQEVP